MDGRKKLGGELRCMAERERGAATRDGATAEARSYYEGVADGLVMAAQMVEILAEPISSLERSVS